MLSQEHNEEVRKLYIEIKIMKRDMKNQLVNVREYMKNNYIQEGIKYVDERIDEVDVTRKFVITKNISFDAIVNNKFAKANSMGIKTLVAVNFQIDEEIEGTDINIIIGNLLDNAIEACENNEESKQISLLIGKKKDYILIEVSKTIDKPVLSENRELLTTKRDKENHGMGIKSVKNVVEKYRGIINFTEENNIFTCKILLLDNNTDK